MKVGRIKDPCTRIRIPGIAPPASIPSEGSHLEPFTLNPEPKGDEDSTGDVGGDLGRQNHPMGAMVRELQIRVVVHELCLLHVFMDSHNPKPLNPKPLNP